MIDQPTIERILGAANIVDIVQDYVTLRRSGTSYKGLCPFHDDKTPSFYVSPAKGIFKCFSCGKGGDAVHFVMYEEQVGYFDALRILAQKYGIPIQEHEMTDEDRRQQSERESMFVLNEWAANYFHDILLHDPDGQAVGLAYFRSRGFRDDIIEKFRLGFCLDQWDAMSKTALNKGYRQEYLTQTGLSIEREKSHTLIDKFRGRAIFPWFNVSGKVVAFGGRVLDARTKGVAQKYVNSPDSVIYHKSQELYGLFQAKKQIAKDDLVYMVEGYTDVISMHQSGIENVVANSGTALNEAQIRLLHRFTQNITLIYDSDEAGIHAALRGTDMLLAEGMNVKVLLLPENEDPDSFARHHSGDEFRQYVSEHAADFIRFKSGLFMRESANNPLKRTELANNILQSICVIPDEMKRATYVHECAELMDMEEQMMLRQCTRLRRDYVAQRRQEREREQQRAANAVATTPSTQNADSSAPNADSSVVNTLTDTSVASNLTDSTTSASTPLTTPQPSTSSNPSTGTQGVKLMSRGEAMQQKIQKIEKLIMTQLVRHGEEHINSCDADGNDEQITVVDFVVRELAIDGLRFSNTLYAAMLDAVSDKAQTEGFSCSRYFQSCGNEQMSLVSTEMQTERYQLSANQQIPPENDSVAIRISHLMLDYKFQIVSAEVQRLRKQLASPEVVANPDKQLEILKRSMQLNEVKRRIAERLGERVM